MVKDHSDSEREETCCRHMGYSFKLAARVLLYASSYRQDNTYHSLCYTSCGGLAGTRNITYGMTPKIYMVTVPLSNTPMHRLHLFILGYRLSKMDEVVL